MVPQSYRKTRQKSLNMGKICPHTKFYQNESAGLGFWAPHKWIVQITLKNRFFAQGTLKYSPPLFFYCSHNFILYTGIFRSGISTFNSPGTTKTHLFVDLISCRARWHHSLNLVFPGERKTFAETEFVITVQCAFRGKVWRRSTCGQNNTESGWLFVCRKTDQAGRCYCLRLWTVCKESFKNQRSIRVENFKCLNELFGV